MVNRSFISIITLLMVISLFSAALIIPAAAGDGNDGNSPVLTVYVFHGDTERYLAGAHVKAHLEEENSHTFIGEGRTDENGTLSLPIRAGIISIEVSKEGYEGHSSRIDAREGDPRYRASVNLIPIDNEPPENVHVLIWPVSVEGMPIPEATVVLKNLRTGEAFRGRSPPGSPVEMDLPEGAYEGEVSAEGFEPLFLTLELFGVDFHEMKVELKPLHEDRLVELTIKVVSPRSNERVREAMIELLNIETGEMFETKTGEGCVAEIEIPMGNYLITAWAEKFGKGNGEFAFFDGDHFEVCITLECDEPGWGALEGKVADGTDMRPLAASEVSLFRRGEPGEPEENCREDGCPPEEHEKIWEARTDEKGHFFFEGLPSGPYEVHAFRDGYHKFFDKVVIERDECHFMEIMLKPMEHEDPEDRPEMILVKGYISDAESGLPIGGAEIIIFHEKPDMELREFPRPHLIFEYIDENSDGKPEVMLLKADLDGDGRIDLHYVYIDENSDGNPESINIETSIIPRDFHMALPGLMEYLELMRPHNEPWDDEDWEDEDWEDEDWEDEDWDDEDEEKDETRSGDPSTEDERSEEEQRREEERREEEERQREEERRKERIPEPGRGEFREVSSDDGLFELKLPMGKYQVIVKADGYLPYGEMHGFFPVRDVDGREEQVCFIKVNVELVPGMEDRPMECMKSPECTDPCVGASGEVGMEREIREFMKDDTLAVDLEPFREILENRDASALDQDDNGNDGGDDGDDGDAGTEGTSDNNKEGVFGEDATKGYISAGIIMIFFIILAAFIVVAKRNRRSSEKAELEVDDSDQTPEDDKMRHFPARRRVRPIPRSVRLRRRVAKRE